jgi:hypothetical protein
LLTPPVEVMITTITTCGCSDSTSMWRIVEVFDRGAETTASRLVTCESVSVVTRIASSTSRRISDSSIRRSGAVPLPGGEQAIDDVAVTGVGGHAPGRGVRMGEQPELLEQRQFVADVDGPQSSSGSAAIALDATGCPGSQVVLDHLAQDRSCREVSVSLKAVGGRASPPGLLAAPLDIA